VGGKTKQTIRHPGLRATAAKQATGKDSKSAARSKKGNAQRARKRAAARKVRKNKLLTLLARYDKAVKEGNKKATSKLFAAFNASQLVRSEIDEMRAVVAELNSALSAVDKQIKKNPAQETKGEKSKLAPSPERILKNRVSAEKKLGEAQQRLKRAQTAEQAFFATLTKKQAKNGVCPFCQIKRISVDSHVMDMHPPRWGEYLTLLGKLK
jgi:transposase